MNEKQVDAVIKAMEYIEERVKDMRLFLEDVKKRKEAQFASMTDIKTDIGRWEYNLAYLIEEAEDLQ